MKKLIYLLIIPVLSFSQNKTSYEIQKSPLKFNDRLTFHHSQKQSNNQQGTDDGEKGRVFFYHSMGVGILAIGQDPKLDFNSLESVGLHAYYAPKLAFRIGSDDIAFLGSNLQLLGNADLGLAAVFPISLGLSHRLSNDDSDDDDAGIWVFANGGIGASVFFGTDPADDDLAIIKGPYADLGLRYGSVEIKASLLKAFKNTNDGFILGLALGIVF